MRLGITIRSCLAQLPADDKKGNKASYLKYQLSLVHGGLPFLQYYGLGSVTFVMSDSILAYTKFCLKGGRDVHRVFEIATMTTYYIALLLIALSALQAHTCLKCLGGDLLRASKKRRSRGAKGSKATIPKAGAINPTGK